MLTEVRLYGHLGEKFGKTHMLAVRSAAEAIHALGAIFPSFRRHMAEHSEPGYYVIAGKNTPVNEDQLTMRNGAGVLKIVPAVAGKKSAGAFQIIFGVVLIAIGAAIQIHSGGAATPAAMFFYKMGAGMILGGVAAYLSQPPGMDQNDAKADQKKSYAFDGPENTVAEGGPVPVVYGLVETGSTVGSMGIYVEEYSAWLDNEGEGYHIERPHYETLRYFNSAVGGTGVVVNDVIEVQEGTAPYTLELLQDAGMFKIVAGVLQTISGDVLPEGTWPITLQATDSSSPTPKVCKKSINYTSSDMDWRRDDDPFLSERGGA